MSRRNIEDGYLDANGEERVQYPHLVRYNAFRRQRGYSVLNLSEFEARCDWMRTYRETFDDAEREHVAGLLRQQDKPVLRNGEFPVEPTGMPAELRAQLEELGARWSAAAVPRRSPEIDVMSRTSDAHEPQPVAAAGDDAFADWRQP